MIYKEKFENTPSWILSMHNFRGHTKSYNDYEENERQ